MRIVVIDLHQHRTGIIINISSRVGIDIIIRGCVCIACMFGPGGMCSIRLESLDGLQILVAHPGCQLRALDVSFNPLVELILPSEQDFQEELEKVRQFEFLMLRNR